MGTLTVQDILAKLGPRQGIGLVYDIFLYVIFIMAVIVMFMQSDKQTIPTILAGLTAAMAVIAKLDVLEPLAFGSLVVNAIMFVAPLIIAGITRAKKSIPLSVFTGLLAGIYFFAFWFFVQRG